MKAGVLHSPDSLPVYEDFDEPVAADGSEIVDLVASGIHHFTRAVAAGRHYSQAGFFPVIPGLNAVARTADGGLVFTSSAKAPYGTLAERISSPDDGRFPLPDDAPAAAVAAGVNPGMASWLPLTARQAEKGKLGLVLVLGVTGMSGYLAAQNAKLLGATRVIGAGRNPAALDRAAEAGTEVIALTGEREADTGALAAALGDEAPDLVLDFVWGPIAESAFAALSQRGATAEEDIRYVEIGGLGGPEAAVPSALLRSRRLSISGSGVGSVSPDYLKAQIPAYLKVLAGGAVQVPFRTFPLSRVAEAWSASAETGPRVVVLPD
jgi:NADPH:quinone reductase-like Zn-dependent oxidoreductase